MVEGLDIQAIIDHVDIGKVLENVDLNVVLERVDLDRLIDRIDVNKILLRLDPSVVVVLLNLLLPQLDMNAVVARLDFDQIVERIDVNAIVERVDVDALVERTELGAIVARAGAGVASDVIDSARSAGVGLDSFVQRWVDRILRRQGSSEPSGPAASHPRARAGDVMTVRLEPDRDVSLQGPLRRHRHQAGGIRHRRARGNDALHARRQRRRIPVVVVARRGRLACRTRRSSSVVALAAWLLVYFAYPIAVGGRTLGMALVGLEVVTKDGRHVDAKRAVLRTLCLPLSLILLGIGILMILINRQRRALHDLIAGTAVVYSWNARAARLRFLAKRSTESPA